MKDENSGYEPPNLLPTVLKKLYPIPSEHEMLPLHTTKMAVVREFILKTGCYYSTPAQ